ncbi:MAG: undecaprenyl-phosphate glucose phosphotransferase [Proteobacteria bacterium]|nr:undecaprenyl-phosphate glucose phosphotransferase [Pseudomonadota bacterium]
MSMLRNRGVVAADLQTMLLGMVRVVDVSIVVLAALIAYWIRHSHETYAVPSYYLIAIAMAAVLTAVYMEMADLYIFANLSRLSSQIGKLAVAWGGVVLSLIALAYFTQTSVFFSRAFVLGWFVLSFAGFMVVRLLLLPQIDHWQQEGRLSINIAVVGASESGENLIQLLEAQSRGQYRIVGVFDDVRPRAGDTVLPIAGSIEDLIRYARTNQVDEIVVALPWRSSGDLEDLVKKLKTLPVNVRLCPDYAEWMMSVRGFHALAGVPMLSVLERPLSGWSLVLKTLEDRILAAILLLLCLPLAVAAALAIKVDSRGPVLFRQNRYGFNNDPITVYKFRTMYVQPGEADAVPQAKRNDPRVTRVGAFLRRASLDELPQLINVLKGEMSLVGPRPHAVQHNEQYAAVIDDYLSRHRVKPGITGWAQVNGLRGETDTPEKMRQRVLHDLYYIDNWSLYLDLKILLLTPFVCLSSKNAY